MDKSKGNLSNIQIDHDNIENINIENMNLVGKIEGLEHHDD